MTPPDFAQSSASTRTDARSQAHQRTARLFGGPAHGHTCPIPFKNRHLMLTMISDQPAVLDLNQPTTARHLLDVAQGDWHLYHEIEALGPDANGLLPLRHVRELPEPLERFCATIRHSTQPGNEADSNRWQQFEQFLIKADLCIDQAVSAGVLTCSRNSLTPTDVFAQPRTSNQSMSCQQDEREYNILNRD